MNFDFLNFKLNNIIISDYTKGERLINLLKLNDYTEKYDVFTVILLNKTIILYSNKLDATRRFYYILKEYVKAFK